jgi:hypothetical protein
VSIETILAALDRHGRIFDLSGDLGDALLDVAVSGVTQTFNSQADPDGTPWEPLNSEYARIKARLFPGMPMGVATTEMREGIPGERGCSADEARWTFGATEPQRDKAVWFQRPPSSRPARKFAGLTEGSRQESREVLEAHFKEHV